MAVGTTKRKKASTAASPKRRKTAPVEPEPAAESAEEPAAEPAEDLPDVAVEVELPPEEPTDEKAAEAQQEDSDSSSSDSESSSESSSSSSESSESESEVADDETGSVQETKQDPVAKRSQQIMVLRQAQLKREELGAILLDQPPEEHHKLVNGAFVSIKIGEKVMIAQISSVEPSPAYQVQHASRKNEFRTLEVQLRCVRGKSERVVKVSSVSNQPIQDEEFQQWEKTMIKLGIDVDLLIETLQDRAVDISTSKVINYDEATVNRILASKPKIEFDAQKQSRKAFEVQCGLTHFDISNIRESEVPELKAKYDEALEGLHHMQRKESAHQSEWFESRRDLFSLKEINRKNLGRQIRDDRHALKFALDDEATGAQGLNVFERRACRPVSAWDTKLTEVEALKALKKTNVEPEKAEASEGAKEDAKDGAKDGAKAAPETATAASSGAKGADSTATPAATASGGTAAGRVASVLQAHRRANLLEQLGSLMAATAA